MYKQKSNTFFNKKIVNVQVVKKKKKQNKKQKLGIDENHVHNTHEHFRQPSSNFFSPKFSLKGGKNNFLVGPKK